MTNVKIGETALPSNDALSIDALHVPANCRSAEGAWYDAFGIANQRFVVWIGNVAGSDVEAAALRLAVRKAFRSSATPGGAGTVLGAADALFGRQTAAAAAACATAIVGIVDCTDRTFTYVSAGHPAPLIRYRDGAVALLPADGLADRDHPRAQVVVNLNDAAVLLLYSNVLVQAAESVGDGMRRLQRVLADDGDRTAHCGSAAVRLAQRMLDGRPHADVALLALSFPARRPASSAIPAGDRPRWSVSWSFDTSGDTSNGARRAFLALLCSSESSAKTIDLPAAELIFGELLGNVVAHAPGPVEILLDWTAEVPVLHVLDSGCGFRSRRSRERLPIDDFSESGRGLFIITAYAVKFCVLNRRGRGTHACATLATLA